MPVCLPGGKDSERYVCRVWERDEIVRVEWGGWGGVAVGGYEGGEGGE